MLIVALVVVQQDDKTLLIQEAKPNCRGQWFLPGGRLEPGEALTDAAVREAREEAGVEIELEGLLCVDQAIAQLGAARDRLRFVFKGRVVGGALKAHEDEHSLRARWVARSELAALELRGPIVERAIALAESGPPLLPVSAVRVLTDNDGRALRT